MLKTMMTSLLTVTIIFIWGCSNSGQKDVQQKTNSTYQAMAARSAQGGNESKVTQKNQEKYAASKITFIELGSVNCIPCRMMQPIMKSAEKKYGDQIEVIFYDVWKPEQKHYAQKYGIRVIPTQVFLDASGREIYRHEGFFPEEELDEFLQAAGLEIQSNSQGN